MLRVVQHAVARVLHCDAGAGTQRARVRDVYAHDRGATAAPRAVLRRVVGAARVRYGAGERTARVAIGYIRRGPNGVGVLRVYVHPERVHVSGGDALRDAVPRA